MISWLKTVLPIWKTEFDFPSIPFATSEFFVTCCLWYIDPSMSTSRWYDPWFYFSIKFILLEFTKFNEWFQQITNLVFAFILLHSFDGRTCILTWNYTFDYFTPPWFIIYFLKPHLHEFIIIYFCKLWFFFFPCLVLTIRILNTRNFRIA